VQRFQLQQNSGQEGRMFARQLGEVLFQLFEIFRQNFVLESIL
jgi:hypothetical protein